MKNKTRSAIFVILVLWQLLVWFLFVPSKYSDPMSPAGELAPLFYYLLGMPFGILGVILAFPVLKNRIELAGFEKVITWLLLIISIFTAIPPLFLIARYVFYPLVKILEGI